MHIITERLVLREFVIDDWPAVLAYQRDPLYLRFYPWSNRTEAQVRDFVEMFVEQQAERPRRKFQFAITFPNDDRVIGNCGIRRKPENDWEADIGYELAPEYWNRGYATEAALAVVNFGFQTLKYTASRHGASLLTQPLRECWRRWECNWKGGCERMSTSRDAGGIPCSTDYLRVSGGLWPRIADWNGLTAIHFPEESCIRKNLKKT
jgi:hypothetical protein